MVDLLGNRWSPARWKEEVGEGQRERRRKGEKGETTNVSINLPIVDRAEEARSIREPTNSCDWIVVVEEGLRTCPGLFLRNEDQKSATRRWKTRRNETNDSPSCSKRGSNSPPSSRGHYHQATKRGSLLDLDGSKGRAEGRSVEARWFPRLVWAASNENERVSFSLSLSPSHPQPSRSQSTHSYSPNNHQLVLPNANQELSRMTPSDVPHLVLVVLQPRTHHERELTPIGLDV